MIDFEIKPAQAILEWAIQSFQDRFGIVTSFQAEGMVMLDMAWRINPRIRVVTLDTGRLPAETYRVIETVRTRYGIAVEMVPPQAAELSSMWRYQSACASSLQTGDHRFMNRTIAVFFFGACLALAQQDHRAMVNEHGDHVMGFSHDKTTHHFELHYDGGLIDVRADDAKDGKSRDEIRSHFRHIAQMFSAGNFNAPMLVHGKDVPGTATMAQLKDQLHWDLQETPRGARLVVTADNKASLAAVHRFLRFQIEDHKTGDCTAVR